MKATAIAGAISGRMIRRTICPRVAPSTRAASITSRGSPSTAAKRIRKTSGVQCQTSTITTDQSASDVFDSQPDRPEPDERRAPG